MENNSDQNTQEQKTPTTEASAAAPAENTPDPLAEAQQKYVYLYAEFENYKKRMFKERQETVKYALEGIASDLLQVLDNLERAVLHAKPEGDPNLLEGLKMVLSQFRSTMQKHNIQEVPSDGQVFNPEFHEAVGQTPSDRPQGTIVETVQKGYTLHGRLVRAARVMVSSGNASV